MRGSCFAGLGIAAAVLVGTAILAAPGADAITYGQEDCDNLSENLGCQHPNTVSLSGFRAPTADEDTESLISSVRCSGSLLS
ncbi:MAG TPA: hypothetical protein VFI76_10505, partial [Terrimicrobiaceae bacterium]|nr:hypothetical protein [Terrimicrobiaceae bacterium]